MFESLRSLSDPLASGSLPFSNAATQGLDASSLIFVDSRLSNVDQLLSGLHSSNVVILDANRDGIDQITETLQQYTNLSSIHIFSHGSAGTLQLGKAQVSAANLNFYSNRLQSWQKELASGADILLYGCDVGAGDSGRSFLHQFSQFTGADIAASTNLTGSSSLGGDWILEVQTGQIETAAIAIKNYDSILPIYNGTNYVLTTGLKTWEAAQAEAVSLGGNLVTINDVAEQTWLQQTFGTAEGLWIGITDQLVEGQFAWVSGQPVTYANWAPGEPNNGGSSGQKQDYGWMNADSLGRWDDNFATATLRGIIEIPNLTPDTIAPTASLSAPPLTVGGDVSYDFTVTYSDNLAVNASSLDGSDIRVTGPNSFSQLATLVSVSPIGNGTPRLATYRLAASGGSWDSADNGTYSFGLQANQVTDLAGNAAAAATLGTLVVNLATAPPPTAVFLSDLTPTAASNGSGAYERDRSNGEGGPTDGKPIQLNGVTYTKGLGVHAASDITYTLNGQYTSFLADIGVDDEVANNGSVVFQVYGDNVLLYTSSTLLGSSPTQSINVNVSGRQTLRLVVTDSGDNNYFDHADWANARLLTSVDPDTTPPTASLTAAPLTTGGGTTYDFTVTYGDDTAISLTSLDNADIRVTGPNSFNQLASLVSVSPAGNGTPRIATYRITAPGGTWDIADNGTYSFGLQANQVTDLAGNAATAVTLGTLAVNIPTAPPPSNVFLSDLTPTAASNGSGPYERDRSNGESGSTDGKPIQLNGVTYTKGLGVHASSDLTYALNGQYASFLAEIGVDDEVGIRGSVVFQVFGDGVLLYNSGVLRGDSATQSININVSGRQTLRLLVTDGGDNNYFDHADWANASLVTATASPGVFGLETNAYNARETDGTVSVAIVRNQGSAGTVTIDYRTAAATATAGSDYTSVSGTVTFAPGETRKTINIPILDDLLPEGNEQFIFTVDNITGGGTLFAPRTATVTIVDNEQTTPLITFNDFSNTSGLNINGNANKSANTLQLTPNLPNQRGSAFFKQAVSIVSDTSFQTQFQFQLTGGTGGAGGFAFILENAPQALSALGSLDGGLGYEGIGQSLAIEFDTNQNAWDTNSNNISILQNGNVTTPLATVEAPFDLNSGSLLNAWIDYNGITNQLNVFLSNTTTKPTTAALSTTVDLAAIVGSQAFLGFSAATGSLTNAHTITNWSYASDSFLLPTPPPGPSLVQSQAIVGGLTLPTAIAWTPDGSEMLIAEKGGVIKVFKDGQLQATPFLDLSAQVNSYLDRGLLDIVVNPNFFTGSPYVYVVYTYDPPEVNQNTGLAGPDGSGNRVARVSRFTADASTNYTTAVPGSEVVLVGANGTWNNFNAFVDSTINLTEPPAGILPNGTNVRDILVDDSTSHSPGALAFGPDGALYVGVADGTSYNEVDSRAVRVQDINNLSGKILRIDPITGAGLADNPFYDGDAGDNRSRVYAYGFRNPFRLSIDQSTGRVYAGDVGWGTWEEIDAVTPGANYGWPFYEGGSGVSLQATGYSSLPQAQAFYASGQTVTPSLFALNHFTDGINAIILGDTYSGNVYPAQYSGDLFFNDLGQGIIRNANLNAAGQITSVDTFTTGAKGVVQILTGPDGYLYFVNLYSGLVGRWFFA